MTHVERTIYRTVLVSLEFPDTGATREEKNTCSVHRNENKISSMENRKTICKHNGW